MTDTAWALQSQLDRLYRRMRMVVAPTKILATDDSDVIHKVQLRVQNTPEILDQVGVMQIYGLASHAPVGTDATALFVMGDRSNPVVIATGNQKARLRDQKAGEISLYTDEGDTIKLQRNNQLNINSKDTIAANGQKAFNVATKTATIKADDQIIHDTPLTTVTKDLKAQGIVDASQGFFVNGHPIGGGQPGPPGPPGQPGQKGDKGDPGTPGTDGQAATVDAGPTITGAPGTMANVVNRGTTSAAIFEFTIPRGGTGNPGTPGAPGVAATLDVGTTTTGAPGTDATVVNTGTTSAAIFDFTIPAGLKGDPGPASAITALTAGTGLTGGGSTGNVTIALQIPVAIPNGGTGSTTPAQALTNLGALPVAGGTMTGALTLNGAAPQISLANGASNFLLWNNNGVAPPSLSTRSLGTKLVLYPNTTSSSVDFAIGIDAGTMWFTGGTFRWYDGANNLHMTLGNNGNLQISGSNARFAFGDRAGGTGWQWYSNGNAARLFYNGADRFWVGPTGQTVISADVTPLSLYSSGTNDCYLYLSNSQRTWLLGPQGANNSRFIIFDQTAGQYRIWIDPGGSINTTDLVCTGRLTCNDFQSNNNIYTANGWVQAGGGTVYVGSGALTNANGTLTWPQAIKTTGTVAILQLAARDDANRTWGIYSTAGITRLWDSYTGDQFSVDLNGNIYCRTAIYFGSGNASTGMYWYNNSNYLTTGSTVRCSGMLPNGDNNASSGLSGTAWAQVASYWFNNTSDAELKRDIRPPAAGALAAVCALDPVEFHWRETETEDMPFHRGFLAQDVRQVLGDRFAGWSEENGVQGLAYNELVAVLWQAVQELSAEVAELRGRVH